MPASIVYGLDEPAQDSRDMTGAEMEHCLAQAISSASTDGSGWVGTYCTQAEVSKALTIMVATKINWFCTNHHMGQNRASKFIAKVMSTTYPWAGAGEGQLNERAKDAAWEVGHWISTHLALTMMNMRTGVRVLTHYGGSPIGATILAEDMKVRCNSAPAGMAKHALVYSSFLIYQNNPI